MNATWHWTDWLLIAAWVGGIAVLIVLVNKGYIPL